MIYRLYITYESVICRKGNKGKCIANERQITATLLLEPILMGKNVGTVMSPYYNKTRPFQFNSRK